MEAVPSVGGDSPVLLLDDVHKLYNPGPLQVHVLKGVSLSVDEGDYVAIMGHSGTGRARCSTSSGAWTSRRRGGT